jgi:hypothetical protein
MNLLYDTKEQDRVAEARESFSGRLLSDAQFEEAMAVTGIVEREIRKSGSFKEKLGDYAYAFARTENFDAGKAETVLRDLFRARTDQTMNQMREELAEREAKLGEPARKSAYDFALAVGDMIEKGEKISFNRAFAHLGQELAGQLGITDAGAKRLMREEFKAAEGSELYDWGKELEEKFYRPQIDAERQQSEERQQKTGRSRKADADEGGDRQRSRYARRESAKTGEGAEAPPRRSTQSRSRLQYSR